MILGEYSTIFLQIFCIPQMPTIFLSCLVTLFSSKIWKWNEKEVLESNPKFDPTIWIPMPIFVLIFVLMPHYLGMG